MQIRSSETKDTPIQILGYLDTYKAAVSLIALVMASLWAWPNNKQQLIRSTTAVFERLKGGVARVGGGATREGARAFGL